jgi:hypothetical protein
VQLLTYWPRAGGVYLLHEDGEYYIGQSVDVPARYASHRLNPLSCKFKDPRCVMLAKVTYNMALSYSENNHTRLNAEARFIAAALQMDLPITNTLSEWKRGQLGAKFPDLREERRRLELATELLTAP